MNIEQAYKLLNISSDASDDEVARSYKSLAMQYHPDRNRERVAWATETMARVNNAYSEVMAYRFKRGTDQPIEEENREEEDRFRDFRTYEGAEGFSEKKGTAAGRKNFRERPARDELIDRFARIKDASNSALYKFFQYNLYNMARRGIPSNSGIFNSVVKTLRRGYHACSNLQSMTDDSELINHFSVFREMLYNFYRASECANVIDSYRSQYDVDAYRQYKKGEDHLHLAHKEIFYNRHNRGVFNGGRAMSELLQAESVLSRSLNSYSDSSWAVEIKIKLNYVYALKEYLELFFSE